MGVEQAPGQLVAKALNAQKVAKAKSKKTEVNTKPTPTAAEIKSQISPQKSVESEAKDAGISKEVAELAESGGSLGNALAKIVQAKGKEPKRGLTAKEAEKEKEQLQADIKAITPKGKVKPKPQGQEEEAAEDQDLVKAEKAIQKEEVPAKGFQEPTPDEEKEETASKEDSSAEETSSEEKVGLGVAIEKEAQDAAQGETKDDEAKA